MGRSGAAGYQGIIDEVRFSRVARSHFHPLLGESDASYQRRLRLFKRWTLATPENLLNLLNEAIGEVGGDPVPLILTDTDATVVSATHPVTVFPQSLALGQCLDAAGNRRAKEDEVSGAIDAETGFDPAYLLTHSDARASYSPPAPRVLNAGELPPDPHRMQTVTARRLNALLDLLAAQGIPGQLRVESAFDSRATDLRAVGRAVLLTHPNLNNGQLAALIHRAGFAYVCRRKTDTAVYTSMPTGDYLEILTSGGSATPEFGFDLRIGQTLDFTVSPSLPGDTVYHWAIIACGAGRGRFTTRIDLPTVTLEATAPGNLVVKVEATRRHRTVSGTRTFRVSSGDFVNGQALGSDGSLNVPETIAGQPDPYFHPAYLLTHHDPRVNYGTNLNHRLLQQSTADRLNRLLDLIVAAGGTGPLEVIQGFVPGAAGPQGAGRALTLRPSLALTLSLGRLAFLAHAAGFTYVRRQDPDLLVRQQPEEPTKIIGPGTVMEGGSITLTASPQAGPRALVVGTNRVFIANGGTDTVSEVDPATGSVLRAIKTGWMPGALALNPVGTRLYVANSLSNTISVIEAATGTVLTTVGVGNQPVALTHHPNQPTLYVACRNANTLVAINTTTMASSSLAIAGQPTGLAVTPNGAEVWVAASQGQRIHVVNTGTFNITSSIVLPEAPLDIALSPDGLRAYATFPANGRIRIFDVAGRAVLGSLNLGVTPQRLTMALDGSTLYVTDPSPPEMLYLLTPGIGAPFLTLRDSTRVRRNPTGVAAGPSQVYVANQASGEISVIDPQPGQVGVSDNWRLGSGLGESLSWVVRPSPSARASLSSTTDATVNLKADAAGPIVVRAVMMHRDHTGPYTFEVRLKPALEAAGAIIRKDQYDLIMNILNTFHPLGVEVSTRAVREHVIEVREGLLNAFPDYTYPNYRVRTPVARRQRKE
jgi:YVTN family beta-propeller protein